MTRTTGSLDRLLRPASIAVLGGHEATLVIEQCENLGFSGDVWPVHPRKKDIRGRPAYPSLHELPGVPDATFIGVNRHRTIEVVDDLRRMRAGGAVCYASGFKEAQAETGDGALLQSRLVETAGDMPILGPNCFGFINLLDRALLWPDVQGAEPCSNGVAIVTQSSNMAINMTMQRRGLPIAYVLTAGNQAQLGISDLALGVLDDPRVTAVGLHIEGIGDLKRFESLAMRSREQRVPVVVLQAGRSEQARAAVVSHTASLAGSQAGADALFNRIGVARVDSVPTFLETLKLLHVHGALPGSELCSMSCSGGEAAMMADAAMGRRVSYRPLSEPERSAVKATLSDLVATANPLDYHTFIWGDVPRMVETYSTMMACGFDLSMLVFDLPRADRCDTEIYTTAVDAFEAAVKRSGARAALVASIPENLDESLAQRLMAASVAPMMGIEEAIVAAEAASTIGIAWAQAPPIPLLIANSIERQAVTLDEAESKRRLAEYGLAVPAGEIVETPVEALRVANELGSPVALKRLGVAHKSDLGALRLDLDSPASVEAAATELIDGGAGNGRLLVEEMIVGAVAELLVGVSRDPQYGLMLTLGAGGELVELIDDTQTLLLPVTNDEVRSALLSLRVARLLNGYRGRPKSDIDAVVQSAMSVAQYACTFADRLEEIDVNPLIVRPSGSGAVAADALIRTRE